MCRKENWSSEWSGEAAPLPREHGVHLSSVHSVRCCSQSGRLAGVRVSPGSRLARGCHRRRPLHWTRMFVTYLQLELYPIVHALC